MALSGHAELHTHTRKLAAKLDRALQKVILINSMNIWLTACSRSLSWKAVWNIVSICIHLKCLNFTSTHHMWVLVFTSQHFSFDEI